MNNYALTIYTDLMRLVQKNEAFYYADFELDNHKYRVFTYRLASYSDFCEPSALECRGVMFEIDENEQALRLASLPFAKFFNLYENPFTMDLDLSAIEEIAVKADGSLISTYLHDDSLRLKTKGSLFSDQALAAMRWLDLPVNAKFKDELLRVEKLGATTIMEWCSPDNRIVLPYLEPHLTVLGVRSREDGSYTFFQDIDVEHFPEILKHWIELVDVDETFITKEEFIESVADMQNIEGFVCMLDSGLRFKVKSTWYLALHHTKDSVNTPRRLYEAVLEEATDDMRALFHDDPIAIRLITEMEEFVDEKYNHLVKTVETFYATNKELSRKDYAILGREQLSGHEFGLAMNLYLGRDVNYKETMKKRWKEFGFKDEKAVVE